MGSDGGSSNISLGLSIGCDFCGLRDGRLGAEAIPPLVDLGLLLNGPEGEACVPGVNFVANKLSCAAATTATGGGVLAKAPGRRAGGGGASLSMLSDRRMRIWGATCDIDERAGLAKLGYLFEAFGVASSRGSASEDSLRRLEGDCDMSLLYLRI